MVPKETAMSSRISSNDFSSRRIMLVDDSEHFRCLLREVLKGFGIHSVIEAHDGANAFTELKRTKVDIVITDLDMVPLDGIAFTKLVRHSKRSPQPFLPIIMLTGHAKRDRIFEARDAGVNEFLVKPLNANALKSRMQSVIEYPRKYVLVGNQYVPDRRRQTKEFNGYDRRNEGTK